jgi:hypothetical protein
LVYQRDGLQGISMFVSGVDPFHDSYCCLISSIAAVSIASLEESGKDAAVIVFHWVQFHFTSCLVVSTGIVFGTVH